MYMETGIIRNNKIIDEFEFYPNEDLSLHLRSHEKAHGGDDWFAIEHLTKKDIAIIKQLLKSSEEKTHFLQLQEGDSIDILLHFGVIILNG